MGLRLTTGFTPRTEWIDSAWYKDPAIEWGCARFDEELKANGVTAGELREQHAKDCADCQAMNAYMDTGERRHLRIKDGMEPVPFRFRVLKRSEVSAIESIVRGATRPPPIDGETPTEFAERWHKLYAFATDLRWFWAGCVGLDSPDQTVPRTTAHELRVLTDGVLEEWGLELVQDFYGRLIWQRSQGLTDNQKKASSSATTTGKPATMTATTPTDAAATAQSDGSETSDAQTSQAPSPPSPTP